MKTIIISDIHLGQTASRTSKLLEFLRIHSFDQLIILGDLFEDPHTHKLGDEDWKIVHRIKELSKDPSKTIIWIDGNHDRDLESKIPELIGAEIHHEYLWKQGNKILLAIHGDSFTRQSLFMDYLMTPFVNTIRFIDKYNSHLALFFENFYALISGMSYLVSKGAISFAEIKNSNVVFCGHTHYPINKISKNNKGQPIHYYNTGSWTRSPSTYAYVDDAGTVFIKKF